MNEILLEMKELAEDGTFKGIASVYGVEDLGGDIIDKGAFSKTIADNPTVAVLWQHDSKIVIGEGEIKEWQGKILINGKLDMEDPNVAQNYYGKMKRRLVKGLSIGFSVVKSTWEQVEGRMVRHITELKLWEVSAVTFAMLPQARITSVKSDGDLIIRIERAEQEILALKAAKSTPAPEPEKAEEPPIEQKEEPVKDHSALYLMINSARMLITH